MKSRDQQHHHTANDTSDAGDYLRTRLFVRQEGAAEQQGHQRVGGDKRRDNRYRTGCEGTIHRQDRKAVAQADRGKPKRAATIDSGDGSAV